MAIAVPDELQEREGLGTNRALTALRGSSMSFGELPAKHRASGCALERCLEGFGSLDEVSVSAIPYWLKPVTGVPLRKIDMTSQLPQETIELYERILKTYKEDLKIDPNYPFVKHCSKWNANDEKVCSWLNSRYILISDLKNKAQELKSAQMFKEAQQRGMFAQVHPETEVMSGWRSTEIPRAYGNHHSD